MMTLTEKIKDRIEQLKGEVDYHENVLSVLNKLKLYIDIISDEQASKGLEEETKLYQLDNPVINHNNSVNRPLGWTTLEESKQLVEEGYKWDTTSKELKIVERDLMERPSDESVRNVYSGLLRLNDALQHTFYGSQMHDSKFHGGEDTWSFPEGVREKLKDNERYRVWYTKHDAADPCDTSCHYCVYYIKKI